VEPKALIGICVWVRLVSAASQLPWHKYKANAATQKERPSIKNTRTIWKILYHNRVPQHTKKSRPVFPNCNGNRHAKTTPMKDKQAKVKCSSLGYYAVARLLRKIRMPVKAKSTADNKQHKYNPQEAPFFGANIKRLPTSPR